MLILKLKYVSCTGRNKILKSLYLVPRLRMPGIIPPSPYVLMVWYLINQRYNFIFTLLGREMRMYVETAYNRPLLYY
jgi:hypothetical protein